MNCDDDDADDDDDDDDGSCDVLVLSLRATVPEAMPTSQVRLSGLPLNPFRREHHNIALLPRLL